MFKKTLKHEQKSSFNLIKIHDMLHFSPSLRRSGSPFEYSTNMYEHLHINLMKKSYRASNRRDFTGHILKRNSLLQAYRRKFGELESFESSASERVTALDEVYMKLHDAWFNLLHVACNHEFNYQFFLLYVFGSLFGFSQSIILCVCILKAVATGENILSGSYTNLKVSWLDASCLEPSVVSKLPPRAKLLLEAQPDVFQIPMCLEYYKQLNNLEGGTTLQMVTSIAIPAGPGNRFGDWPLYGRAVHEFYLGPYYSDVIV
jgi:hypothetical protein